MEYRSPVCRARICRKSPLIFQHPSFILARRNNRHHFRVSSRMMPMPPGYTKVFGFAPTWCTKKSRNECCGFFVAPFPPGRTHTSRKRSCSSRGDWSLNSVRRTEFLTRPLMVHQSTRCKKLQRVFYCNLSKKVQSGAPSGDENSSGPPPVRRAKTPQWGVFRARESPRWCTRKSRNTRCGFFVAPFPPGRLHASPTARIHLQRPFSISLQHTAISVLKIVSSA